jgi:hypothetical protein
MTSPTPATLAHRALLVAACAQACGGLSRYEARDPDAPVLTALPPPTGGSTTSPPRETESTSSTSTPPPWTSTSSSTSTTSTTGGTTASVRLRRVEPGYGTNAGGTRITLTGEFDSNTEAYVNGVLAARRSRDATTLVVETPPSNVEGWVEVMVQSGGARASLPSGFQYWEDQEGQTGAVGVVAYQQYVGGYWSGGTPADDVFGRFSFVRGSDWRLWQDYADRMNACRYSNNAPKGVDADLAPPLAGAFDEHDPQAAAVRFLGPGGEILRLEADPALGAGWFSDLSLARADAVPGALYDLDAVAGGPDWPGFEVAGALKLPTDFVVTSPRLDRATLPEAPRSLALAWGNNTSDYAVVWIRREAQGLFGGTFTDGYVTCAMDDDGSFTIPAGTWPDWYEGDVLYLKVGRVLERDNRLPHDQSLNALAGVYWVYGAAVTVP